MTFHNQGIETYWPVAFFIWHDISIELSNFYGIYFNVIEIKQVVCLTMKIRTELIYSVKINSLASSVIQGR